MLSIWKVSDTIIENVTEAVTDVIGNGGEKSTRMIAAIHSSNEPVPPRVFAIVNVGLALDGVQTLATRQKQGKPTGGLLAFAGALSRFRKAEGASPKAVQKRQISEDIALVDKCYTEAKNAMIEKIDGLKDLMIEFHTEFDSLYKCFDLWSFEAAPYLYKGRATEKQTMISTKTTEAISTCASWYNMIERLAELSHDADEIEMFKKTRPHRFSQAGDHESCDPRRYHGAHHGPRQRRQNCGTQ